MATDCVPSYLHHHYYATDPQKRQTSDADYDYCVQYGVHPTVTIQVSGLYVQFLLFCAVLFAHSAAVALQVANILRCMVIEQRSCHVVHRDIELFELVR